MNLNELVLYLTARNNMMINFHDTSGIHSSGKFKLDISFKIHSKPFCDIAKSTNKGYRLCTACKALACKKVITDSGCFFGYCPYGLYELVYPVFFQEKLVTILFIGNFLADKSFAEKKITQACTITGVDSSCLVSELKNTENSDTEYILQTAKIIENFIVSALKEERLPSRTSNGRHWAISEIKLYTDTHFRQKVTLKELSKLYFLNEKYAGRIFIRQYGCTFHSYLLNLRLNAAEKLLKDTDISVIDIAMECGFNSISYFNRSFFKKHGLSPTAYRRQ